VDADEVRRLSGLVAHDGSQREHDLLYLRDIDFWGKGPAIPGGGKPVEVLANGVSGDGAALGDLAFGESTVELQTQHFTDLSHG
jgi:hypothetical protein